MKIHWKILTYSFLLGCMAIPNETYAHLTGGNGFASGLTHPFLGVDHLFAMVAVGMIGGLAGGRAVWKIPVTFAGFMVLGGLMGMGGFALPFVEPGIALSVVFFGTLIAADKKNSVRWALACMALFAIFHGHAHGEEMPLLAHPVFYAAGFVVSTLSLHVAGALAASYLRKTKIRLVVLRLAGAGMGLAGFALFAGIVT